MKIKKFLSVLVSGAVVLSSLAFNAVTASAQEKDKTKDVTLTIYALKAKDQSQVTLDSSVTGEKITLPDVETIAGAGFALYKVDDNADDNSWVPEGEPDFVTALTNDSGAVSIVVPGSAQGRYFVTENQKPDSVIGTTIPFYVDLPMTDPNGTDFMYEVYAYPKQLPDNSTVHGDTDSDTNNDDSDDEGGGGNIPTPKIAKKVSEDNGKTWKDEANINSITGHKAYWKVTVDVPKTIKQLTVFKVGDVLDNRLIPPSASEVKASVEGKELAASAYKVSVEKQVITVDFRSSEIVDCKNKKIDIIFPTAIDLKADKSVGEMIPNTATLTYKKLVGTPDDNGNSVDTDVIDTDDDGNPVPTPSRIITSEEVYAWTSAIKGFKHDGDKKALSGAEFTLYSDKSCKNKIASATSDKEGIFEFVGLHDGTYYLKETKVPDGYQENANVLEVTVKMKDNKVTEIDVLNVAKSNLPVTGGAGIIGVSLFGLAIVAIGVLMMSIALKLRRKELGSVA